MPKPCDLFRCHIDDCEDHLHSRDYHSADCACGRTEADCLLDNPLTDRQWWAYDRALALGETREAAHQAAYDQGQRDEAAQAELAEADRAMRARVAKTCDLTEDFVASCDRETLLQIEALVMNGYTPAVPQI